MKKVKMKTVKINVGNSSFNNFFNEKLKDVLFTDDEISELQQNFQNHLYDFDTPQKRQQILNELKLIQKMRREKLKKLYK